MTAALNTKTHDLLRSVLGRLRVVSGPDAKGEHVCWCPFHPDGQGKPPHQPNLQVSERGYICHACKAKGSLSALARHLGIERNGTSGWELVATWPYRGSDSDKPLFYKDRYRKPDGGKVYLLRRRAPDNWRECPHREACPAARAARGKRVRCRDGWIYSLQGMPCSQAPQRVLYNEPLLARSADETVHIPGGEKCVDALCGLGYVAVTNYDGEGSDWRAKDTQKIRGRAVVLWLDADETGRKRGPRVARALHRHVGTIKLVDLYPGRSDGADVYDWITERRARGMKDDAIRAELDALIEATQAWEPTTDAGEQQTNSSDSEQRPSQADRLVKLVISDGVELFHDDLGDGFARVPVGDHREIWRCRSRDFRRWMAGRFYQSEEKAPGSEALRAALNVIEAKARFDGEEYRLHNRIASHGDAIWCDLADGDWRAVKITAEGWSAIADPPILFRRHSHQRPQPEPLRGGSLRDLLGFVNLRDPSQELLLLVYIVCCFVPEVPHPIPVLHGPQGAAKTTLFRMVRRLVDPSAVEVLSFPRDPSELVQQLSHHWAPYYDNVTHMPGWVSDALCRAVTGEGFSKRELYSDDEDIIYQFRRCIGLNGVNVAARRPDLLDRCILFSLEPIAPADRRPEEALWREFEAARPRLLGAIFDLLARAMALRPSIQHPGLPRMADFALWGCAIARALGHSEEDFLSAYEGNTEARNEEALQASPVAAMVVELMDAQSEWEGTPSELLAELEKLAEDHRVNTKMREWPRAAHSLSRRLNEVRPNLAAVGITISTRRDGRHRAITVRKIPANGVTGVTTTPEDEPLDLADLPDDDTEEVPRPASLAASFGEVP